jgi:hypothetical protein
MQIIILCKINKMFKYGRSSKKVSELTSMLQIKVKIKHQMRKNPNKHITFVLDQR